jgi:enterochelin esterase-like enzyme
MQMGKGSGILQRDIQIIQESIQLESTSLGRTVQVDLYMPVLSPVSPEEARFYPMEETALLLINDGQELGNMGFAGVLDDLYNQKILSPLICAGIHAGPDRTMEYGTAGIPDYKGRGAKAEEYTRFVFEELIPAIRATCQAPDQAADRPGEFVADRAVEFKEKAFAGFSLGALSAMDIVWHHPEEFSRAGLFSGSFWWRTKDKTDPDYDEEADRIMQRQVREGDHYPWLKFFFECGTEDEQEDRNHNGIIDSIDDTQDLIRELAAKGYDLEPGGPDVAGGETARGHGDIRYLEIAGGRHEVGTWARAMPEFLLWGWGK